MEVNGFGLFTRIRVFDCIGDDLLQHRHIPFAVCHDHNALLFALDQRIDIVVNVLIPFAVD
ncbi:hypothetical protein D3C78_1943690 [compost metagenome]